MGLYDRDYYQQDRPSFTLGGPRTVVGWLLLVNIVVWIVDRGLLQGQISEYLALTDQTLYHPLQWYQFLTYGFLHALEPRHIVYNMIGLFVFGRAVEEIYGSKEFLRLYLALIVFGGLVWACGEWASGAVWGFNPRVIAGDSTSGVVGASGAIVGLVVLYALHFPYQTILLFFVLPVPAWFVAVLYVTFDILGQVGLLGQLSLSMGTDVSRTAYIVHLAGALLAFLYFRLGWNLGRLTPGSWGNWFRRRPKLRVHREDEDRDENESLGREVDRILAKISREGESSLTWSERRTLRNASRKYQKKRQETDDA